MSINALRLFSIEIETLGKQTKMLFFYPIIPFLYILYVKSFSFGIWMLIFLMPVLVVGPFMKEDNRQVDIFYSTLPVNAKEIVCGRFMYLGFAFLIEIISGVLLYGLAIALGAQGTLLELGLFIGCLLLTAVVCSIEYLIFYRFGANMGKNVMNIATVIPGMVIAMCYTFLSEYLPDIKMMLRVLIDNWILIVAILFAAAIVLILICIKLSIRCCEKKEV